MEKIDTHLHLIYPEKLDYPWVRDVPPLQSAFTAEDYAQAARKADVCEALFMEVDVAPKQAVAEVNLIRKISKHSPIPITGIIAAARPEADDFADQLDALSGALLKGVRRVLHTQDDALSTKAQFRRNVASLAERQLTFDLCVLPRQMPQAIELVDACPQTQFILDHCGVPDIAGNDIEDWAENIRALAHREHVACKLSGLPTYCASGEATAEVMRPWIETCIKAFGWERVVWGSDWPVCTLNSDLSSWQHALDGILDETSTPEQSALYQGNARRLYSL